MQDLIGITKQIKFGLIPIVGILITAVMWYINMTRVTIGKKILVFIPIIFIAFLTVGPIAYFLVEPYMTADNFLINFALGQLMLYAMTFAIILAQWLCWFWADVRNSQSGKTENNHEK